MEEGGKEFINVFLPWLYMACLSLLDLMINRVNSGTVQKEIPLPATHMACETIRLQGWKGSPVVSLGKRLQSRMVANLCKKLGIKMAFVVHITLFRPSPVFLSGFLCCLLNWEPGMGSALGRSPYVSRP